MIKLGAIVALLIFLFSPAVHAEQDVTPKTLCQAIWHAEGGAKATWPYGVRFSDGRKLTKDGAEVVCRMIIRERAHSWVEELRSPLDFVEYVGQRYCPIGGRLDDGRCRHWVKNVWYFLKNP